MSRSLKIDSFTTSAALFLDALQKDAETAHILAAMRDSIAGQSADKAAAKAANEAAKGKGSTAWDYVRDIAKRVDTADAMKDYAPDQRTAVVRELIARAMAGTDTAAHATAKLYTSIAGKAIAAVAAGTIQWHQLTERLETAEDGQSVKVPVPFADVREMLKSKSHKEVTEAAEKLTKLIGKVKGRENDYATAADRIAVLTAILEAAEGITGKSPDLLAALSNGDEVKAAVTRMHNARAKSGKGVQEAASARDAVREMLNAPETGPTVETVAAAAADAREDAETPEVANG